MKIFSKVEVRNGRFVVCSVDGQHVNFITDSAAKAYALCRRLNSECNGQVIWS